VAAAPTFTVDLPAHSVSVITLSTYQAVTNREGKP
jgi:hypothetical protein